MRKQWLDWSNVVLGLWIFFSPWILPDITAAGAEGGVSPVSDAAMWNFYIVGIVVAGVAAASLFAFQVWEEWTNLVLGAWLFVSPWLLGFSSSALFTWNAAAAGALVVVVAGLAILPTLGSSQGPAKHA